MFIFSHGVIFFGGGGESGEPLVRRINYCDVDNCSGIYNNHCEVWAISEALGTKVFPTSFSQWKDEQCVFVEG